MKPISLDCHHGNTEICTIPQTDSSSNLPTKLGNTEKTKSVALEVEKCIRQWNYFAVGKIYFSLRNEFSFRLSLLLRQALNNKLEYHTHSRNLPRPEHGMTGFLHRSK